ncbi:hypothetical protein L218DRAFT_955950 [Marasmius fiardii PR-910]|nr:hypothetical protein L218DRAFT_955950 [Marasmius fiardii PR-910]
MLPLIACVAYAVAGGFLLLAGSLIWTILMFLCRWIDELAKVRRSRGTDLEMEVRF